MGSYLKSRSRRNFNKKQTSNTGIAWQFVYGAITIVVVVLAGYGVWALTRLDAVTLSQISVEGGETISHTAIREIVERELTGTFFLLVPKRFSYLYPHENIVTAVSNVSRVHNVSAVREGRNELKVSFEEYLPYALWCESETQATCVFLDENGYAFAAAPSLQGGSFVRHITEDKEPEAKTQLFERVQMHRMYGFIVALEEQLGLRVGTIVHTKEGDERYQLFGGGELLVAPNLDQQTTFDNLLSILESKEFKHIKPGNFQYIDLRFGNRVFVNEEDPNTLHATTTEELAPAQ